jgi:Flp pilus assembly protein TadD
MNGQIQKGIDLISGGEIEKALNHFDLMVESNPVDHLAIYYVGLCHLKQDKVSTSIIHFNRALELAPNTANYLSDRAVAKLRVKDRDGSMSDLNKAVELDQNNSYRYSLRAFVRNSFGDTEGAIIDYKKAIELDPEDAIALNNLGMAEESQGYKSSAQRRFEKADAISGVSNKKSADHTIEFKGAGNDSTEKREPTYWSTIKSVFTDSKQRAEFFKFTSSLLRGKDGKA